MDIALDISAPQNISRFERRRNSARLAVTSTIYGAPDVDVALKLNVLAVFAVFAFVGAILLGAF